jgi:hypothetical protein
MAAKLFSVVAGRALRTAAGKSDSRQKMILAVRAASRRLRISDDDRHAIQLEETGKASLADMDLPEIGRVLDRLNKGWKGPMGHRAHIGKIKALWWTLYWLGAVEEPGAEALDAFVQRQAHVAALRFLDHRKSFSVIEALKSWAAREGVRWPAGKGVTANDDRRAVLEAVWAKLAERGLVARGGCELYLQRALPTTRALHELDSHELDAAIRYLGKKLRRAIGERRGAVE